MQKINIGKVVLVVATLGVLFAAYWFFYKNPTTHYTAATPAPIAAVPLVLPKDEPFNYIEITASCDPYFTKGVCVNMRSGPSTTYDVVTQLRQGIVLKVKKTTVPDDQVAGRAWYQVTFNESRLYPERLGDIDYVAVDASSVRPFYNVGDILLQPGEKITTQKSIVVDLSQEKLYAYEGKTLFLVTPISTGLEFSPTPLGKFSIFKKTPSRYMQGPIPGQSGQEYDLPGVPWDLYFTYEGAVIHGAYWHDHFGTEWSHGCVNMQSDQAHILYDWVDIGTPVLVQK